MRISSFISFVGFVLVIAGSYSPLLRPFHLFNYDLFQLNKPYGMVVMLLSVVGILGVTLNNRGVLKTTAYITLLLVILVFVAAVFKVNTTFSFIPFKGMASGLSRQIKFKWGWALLFAGSVLAVAGTFGTKPRVLIKPVNN